jgi:hypothetical protein
MEPSTISTTGLHRILVQILPVSGGLRDSHIFLGICQEPTFFHGVKANETEMHDFRV